MIAHLRGRVAGRRLGAVVVDVAGVGYLVRVPDTARVPGHGEPVELHTSLQVRDDGMTLYGFADTGARELFEALLAASGVGPKLALAALSTHRPAVLRDAIAGGDTDTLQLIPGVGRKVAQRLVLELKERLGGDALAGLGVHAPVGAVAEVREALLSLGYTTGEARAATAGLDPDGDASVLLRRALRSLGSTEGAPA